MFAQKPDVSRVTAVLDYLRFTPDERIRQTIHTTMTDDEKRDLINGKICRCIGLHLAIPLDTPHDVTLPLRDSRRPEFYIHYNSVVAELVEIFYFEGCDSGFHNTLRNHGAPSEPFSGMIDWSVSPYEVFRRTWYERSGIWHGVGDEPEDIPVIEYIEEV